MPLQGEWPTQCTRWSSCCETLLLIENVRFIYSRVRRKNTKAQLVGSAYNEKCHYFPHWRHSTTCNILLVSPTNEFSLRTQRSNWFWPAKRSLPLVLLCETFSAYLSATGFRFFNQAPHPVTYQPCNTFHVSRACNTNTNNTLHTFSDWKQHNNSMFISDPAKAGCCCAANFRFCL